MRSLSVSKKLNIAIVGVSLASLVFSFLVLSWYGTKITQDVYQSTSEELIESANYKMDCKVRIGITNAISIANDKRIQTALQTNERKYAIESLKDISIKMKEHTEFQNIKVQIHTKSNISFLRNWEPEKHGDDLSSFRASVVSVNKTLKPISSLEVGRAGLNLRSVIPIMGDNEEHLGSLEFMQGVDSVAKDFDKTSVGFLLLMDGKINDMMSGGKKVLFTEGEKFQNYIISQKFINQDFLGDAKNLDIQNLLKNSYTLSSKYFYTYMKVKDFQDKELGIILLAKPLSVVNSVIDKSHTLIYLALFGVLIMAIAITFVIMLAVRKLVTNPLKIFEEGLSSFFLFLQGKKDYTNNIEINTEDEFGKMANSLKENIAVSAKLHEEINELNTNLESKVEEKTKKISALLDNAGQGFLSFGCDFIVDSEHSAECNRFLGEKIVGKNIAELLFLDTNKREFFKNTVLDIHDMSSNTIKSSLLSLLPCEIILNKRALKLEYKLLGDSKLMMIITNVSAQKKLENKVKKEQGTLKMIVEVVTQNEIFSDTKRDYENFIATCKSGLDRTKTSLHNINEIYRTIHTFKGAFSQLYMGDVVLFLHSIEGELSAMIKENKHTNEKLLSFLIKSDFKSNFEEELDIIKNILGDDFFNSHAFVKIDLSTIKTLEAKINSLFEQTNLTTQEAKEIISQVASLSNQNLLQLLKQYPTLVEQLAQKLEKDIYELKIIGDSNLLISDEIKPFVKSLIHVFRNAVDHGIEDPDTRDENGKDLQGTISCSFKEIGDIIEIIISDDGAGINKEEVKAKALEKGLITEEQMNTLSDDEIYSFIFSEQFSTKETITDISGRGVGMNAVKVELEKIGGTIKINTQENSGTTFIFSIPTQKGEI
ncbi:MAG: cache domain-containing protein [Sulfurimonas sp.]|jgi:two-component system chemotaxis sensor kinase CheA